MPADTYSPSHAVSAEKLHCRRIPSCLTHQYPPHLLSAGRYLQPKSCHIRRKASLPADTILLNAPVSATFRRCRQIPTAQVVPYPPKSFIAGGYHLAQRSSIRRILARPADTYSPSRAVSAEKLHCRQIPSCLTHQYPPHIGSAGRYLQPKSCRIRRQQSHRTQMLSILLLCHLKACPSTFSLSLILYLIGSSKAADDKKAHLCAEL